ncbi:hypothetical protein M514_21408 [Trichuris suis]|uniref:HTH CENPB-type domain-containing protein n=1 Tax=Trichuris suis TaxID=68888 RepID=A0A085NA82_9BILA|nr:hypothetical protein M514_21408 [Trichuris suis]
MNSERPASSKASRKEVKRPKATMTIQQKVELLDMVREKKNFAAVARHYGINESTVRYIQKNEAQIRSSASLSFRGAAENVSRVRNKYIVRMESALALWIKDCMKKCTPLDGNIIRKKARGLYKQFSTNEGAEPQLATSRHIEDFIAGRGWFDRFRKRFNLGSVSLYGQAASADTAAAEKYPDTLMAIIQQKKYEPEQVFNMDETGLFWKKLPNCPYLMKDEATPPGVKVRKDRVTLIMCGNAAGHMLKPGLIHKSPDPRSLKNENKNLLPVFWMHHPKSWMTKALFSQWFQQCFVPQAKQFLLSLGMEFKVLLLLDNAGGHHADVHSEGVQIQLLPPNTTSLIQPMDQGVIRAFKALYTKISLQRIVNAMDPDENFTLKGYWLEFSISACLSVIQSALGEMKKETLNTCWKKLWPDCVHHHEGFSPDEVQHAAVNEAVTLAKLLGAKGFDEISEEQVSTLIDAYSEPLTDADVAELTKSETEEDEEAEPEVDTEEEQGLTLKRLSQILGTARNLQAMIESWDPDMIRALKFSNGFDALLQPYKHLLHTLKKERRQLPITMFLTRMETSQKETAAGVAPEARRIICFGAHGDVNQLLCCAVTSPPRLRSLIHYNQ